MVIRTVFPIFEATRRFLQFVTRRPTFGVRGIVIDDQSQVLLVRHTYVEGWYLPGGGVSYKEEPYEAMVRELWEEAGVHVDEADLFGLYANFGGFKSDHIAVYHATAWRPAEAIPKSLEIAERQFFPIDELPSDATLATRWRLDEWLGRRPQTSTWTEPQMRYAE